MKAIYIPEPGTIEIRDVPEPKASAGNALLEIKAMGICGSDLTAYAGTNPTIEYPLIMGHELAGVVLEIEDNPAGIRAGDHVVVEPYFHCGECYPCRLGNFNNCENMNVLGVRMDGGMAERLAHPIRYLYKIPKDMPWEKAAMVEPLSISLHSLRRASAKEGEFVAISGAGTIGLLAAQAAKARGCTPILFDVVDSRLEFARKMGVRHTANPVRDDVVALTREWTGGDMAPVVVECSGSESGINNALELASNSGRVCLVGWAKGAVAFNQPRVIRKELNLFGSRNSLGAFPECIELINSGKVDVMPLITLRHSMEEVMRGFDDIRREPEKYLKVIGLI